MTPSIKPTALDAVQMTTTVELHKPSYGGRQSSHQEGHENPDSRIALHLLSGNISLMFDATHKHGLFFFHFLSYLL